MKNFFRIFCLSLVVLFSINVKAQTKKPVESVSAGIVNGKAVSLPKPEYPPEARKLNLVGKVDVKVVINESGHVISAKSIGGIENQQIRKVCEEAAMKAEFSPTILSGKPVKVIGVIVYNFIDDETNEQKVAVFGVSTFLYIIRNSASDLKKFNKLFESDDIIKDTIDEFSMFRTELLPLSTLGKTPLESRAQKVDEVIKAVRAKLNASQSWQFELGEDFTGVMYPFILAGADERFDVSKIDENSIKSNLSKIKQLCLTAPPDFPKDILLKLEELAQFSDQRKILSPENFRDFQNNLMALLETISPESTK